MKIYFGSHMQVLALGLAIGALLGWALTRWYYRWRHVRELRGIQRQLEQALLVIGATHGPSTQQAERRNANREGWPSEPIYTADPVTDAMLTELRRRKL